jgi:hypothetical protein
LIRLAVLVERRGDRAEAAALRGRARAIAPDDPRLAAR